MLSRSLRRRIPFLRLLKQAHPHCTVILLSALFLMLMNPLLAEDSTLSGKMSSHVEDVGITQFVYLEDQQATLNIHQALSRLRSADAQTVTGKTFNAGSRESRYWLMLELINRSQKSATSRLMTTVPYRLFLRAHLLREGSDAIPVILDESEQRKFAQRINAFRFLNSKPFQLAPGERARIVLQYETRGATYLPLSLVDETGFQSGWRLDVTLASLFYAFSFTLGIIFLIINRAMKNRTGYYFSGLFFSGLFLIAIMDGYAFKYLWPEAPGWNQYASLVVLFALQSLGFVTAYKIADARKIQPFFNHSALLLALLCAVCIPLTRIVSFSLLAGFASILLFVMFGFLGVAINSWRALKRNRFTLLVILLLTLMMGTLAILFYNSESLPGLFLTYSSYLVFALISLLLMSVIMVHLGGLRNDRERAIRAQLIASQREARINRSLFEAEQKYSQVRELARFRQQQLASASHDMKQPLFSLRSILDGLLRTDSQDKIPGPTTRQQLHDAFDYMEQLCNDSLAETHPETHEFSDDILANNGLENATKENGAAQQQTEAPYPVSLVLDTVSQMFRDEAQAKGLDFRLVPSNSMIQAPPLVVMRIVSNLVSNAVKHTRQGKVLIGCRRRQNQLRIEVHDTGSGIDKEQQSRMVKAYQKGEDSKGEGLGLAISRKLAEQHGLALDFRSLPGVGSCFSLTVPLRA